MKIAQNMGDFPCPVDIYSLPVSTIRLCESFQYETRKKRLTEPARLVEGGETIVVTRNGRPVLDLVPHKRPSGINFEAIAEYKRRHGFPRDVTSMPKNFDRPLAENVLLKPLPAAE